MSSMMILVLLTFCIGGVMLFGSFLKQIFEVMMKLSTVVAAVMMLVFMISLYPHLQSELKLNSDSATTPNIQLGTLGGGVLQLDQFSAPSTPNLERSPREKPGLQRAMPLPQRKMARAEVNIGDSANRTKNYNISPTAPQRINTTTVAENDFSEQSKSAVDCRQPFEIGEWVVAVAFYAIEQNAQRRVEELRALGVVQTDYFNSKCYGTDIGSRNYQQNLYTVTIGPSWEHDEEVKEYAQQVVAANETHDLLLKTVRPVYLQTHKTEEF